MINFFKDFICDVIIPMILLLGVIVIIVIVIVYGTSYMFSLINRSYGALYINGQYKESLYLHYMNISSIGQNGNTKIVTIYKDRAKFIPVRKYVCTDVVVVPTGGREAEKSYVQYIEDED